MRIRSMVLALKVPPLMDSCGASAGTGEPRASADGPYLANGIRIFEVDSDSAVVWARLTKEAERAPFGAPMPVVRYRVPGRSELIDDPPGRQRDAEPVVEFPDGSDINTIEGACPGAPGEARVLYRVEGADAWSETPWMRADASMDFIAHIPLAGLQPNAKYEIQVETRREAGAGWGQRVSGGFKTAAPPDTPQRVVFAVSTGQAYPDLDAPGDGFKIYDQILKLDPSFFVHTGDIVYYDRLAKSPALARWHWQRTYSLPSNVRFHRQVATYFIKDDHDTLVNDCWPTMQTKFMGELTWQDGLRIFREQSGMMDGVTYRTVRWGKDLQIWMVEGRDYRSANDMPDGPDKTIWGAEQMAWFQRTVQESDATFRILISPTPVVGPDRTNKSDNHSNKAFAHEGNLLRAFLASQKNIYSVCGDRHWQYVSADAKTGLREYSCGPASDQHAGGWTNDQRYPEHIYLNVIGGFLAGTVERENGKPVLTMRHYGVNGELLHEDRREPEA